MNKVTAIDLFRKKDPSLIIECCSYEDSLKMCKMLNENSVTASYGQHYTHENILAWIRNRHSVGNNIGFSGDRRIRNMEAVDKNDYKVVVNCKELFNQYEVNLI